MKIALVGGVRAGLALLLIGTIQDCSIETVEPRLIGWKLKEPHKYGPPKRRKKGKVARW